MDPGGLRQGKVRSQEVTTSTLDTPSTSRSISPEKSAQIFTHIAWFCMRVVDLFGGMRGPPQPHADRGRHSAACATRGNLQVYTLEREVISDINSYFVLCTWSV